MLPTRRPVYSGEAAGYREDGATIAELVQRAPTRKKEPS
jgi:hypothetical protein